MTINCFICKKEIDSIANRVLIGDYKEAFTHGGECFDKYEEKYSKCEFEDYYDDEDSIMCECSSESEEEYFL